MIEGSLIMTLIFDEENLIKSTSQINYADDDGNDYLSLAMCNWIAVCFIGNKSFMTNFFIFIHFYSLNKSLKEFRCHPKLCVLICKSLRKIVKRHYFKDWKK
jgi:hypothetical protein